MAQRMKLRILVIDDDEDICLYLKEFLTREGYRVTTVTQPREALPEINGVELLRQLRAIDSDVCVIVMTAYPSV